MPSIDPTIGHHDIASRLNTALQDSLVGRRFGSVEVLGAEVTSVQLEETDGDRFATARVEIVLHMVEVADRWDVDDVQMIRREITHQAAAIPVSPSVRFVPDESQRDDVDDLAPA